MIKGLFEQIFKIVPVQALLMFEGKAWKLEERTSINALRGSMLEPGNTKCCSLSMWPGK